MLLCLSVNTICFRIKVLNADRNNHFGGIRSWFNGNFWTAWRKKMLILMSSHQQKQYVKRKQESHNFCTICVTILDYRMIFSFWCRDNRISVLHIHHVVNCALIDAINVCNFLICSLRRQPEITIDVTLFLRNDDWYPNLTLFYGKG